MLQFDEDQYLAKLNMKLDKRLLLKVKAVAHTEKRKVPKSMTASSYLVLCQPQHSYHLCLLERVLKYRMAKVPKVARRWHRPTRKQCVMHELRKRPRKCAVEVVGVAAFW